MQNHGHETQFYAEAKELTAQLAEVLKSLFAFLPPGTEISILLEDRVSCSLHMTENTVALEARAAAKPDVEICFFPESIRRLKDRNPNSLAVLATELVALWTSGQIRYRLLSTPQKLYERGYVQALRSAAPELQKEITRHTSSLLATATFAVQVAKHSLNELRTKFSKKD